VAVDFERVFAGEGAGRPHENQKDFIEDPARCGADDLSVGETMGEERVRRLRGPEKGAPDPFGTGSASPHDADASRAGRCGDRRDGVCLGHRGLG